MARPLDTNALTSDLRASTALDYGALIEDMQASMAFDTNALTTDLRTSTVLDYGALIALSTKGRNNADQAAWV